MTYLDIAAKVLGYDQDPLLYRDLCDVCIRTCPSYFEECPKSQRQAFEYYFRTIHKHVKQMPKHQISLLIQRLNERN